MNEETNLVGSKLTERLDDAFTLAAAEALEEREEGLGEGDAMFAVFLAHCAGVAKAIATRTVGRRGEEEKLFKLMDRVIREIYEDLVISAGDEEDIEHGIEVMAEEVERTGKKPSELLREKRRKK